MPLLIRLSLRNLFRQKRRSFLLGSAIALGVMFLVVANAFSQGISDILFNRIMRWVTGHVTVRFNEKGNFMREIFRDKERVLAALQGHPEVERINEGVGLFMRAIGNGKSDNIILVGVDTKANVDEKLKKEIEESFTLFEGNWSDIEDPAVENPVIVSQEKARALNVKKNDVIRVRFRNMFAQDQAARLTVRGVMKNDNIFMQPVIFIELSNAHAMLGYRLQETASLSLTLKNPQRDARAVADKIHGKLAPGPAYIIAAIGNGARRETAVIYGFKSDDESKTRLASILKLTAGSMERALKKDGVVMTDALAQSLRLSPGDDMNVLFQRKFEKTDARLRLPVAALCRAEESLGENAVLMNEEKFYDVFYENWPANEGPRPAVLQSGQTDWLPLLSPEWILLKRTQTTDDYEKKFKELGRKKWRGTTVDVSTMYETASDILKLEGVLKLITLSAALVLFFIILLGVVNTLRMTIRERTREIGTLRAIGMQRSQILALFIFETFFLTLMAAAAGALAGFAVMGFFSRIPFNLEGNPFGMLLLRGHIHFLPTVGTVCGNMVLIIAIAVVTAYFPARQAARLSPVKALGHFG